MASTFFNFRNPIPTQPLVDPEPQRQFVSTTEDKKEAPKREPVAAQRKPAAAPVKDAFDTEFEKYMSKIEPFTTEVESAKAKALQAQAEVDRKKSDVEMQVLQGKADEATLNAKKQREIIESQNKLRQEYPAFAPDVNNLQNLGKLFSLITTLGVMSGGGGKLGAQNIMAAMTGMLKGYNDGNEAEFTRQKAIFDENIKTIDAHNSQVEKDLKELMELQKSDYEAATIKREMIIRREGSQSIIGKQLELGNATAALETAQAKQRVAESIEKQLSDAEKRAKELAYQRETSWNRPTAAGKGTGTSVLLAGRAENIREAITQVAADVENISKFPPTTVLGTFSGMAGQEGTGLVSSIASTFARKVTQPEVRQLDVLISGLEANMAMALGGGYASSAAKSRIDMYKRQIPREGDSAEVVATFLARVRQEMDILGENFESKPGATPEMNEKVQKAIATIDKAVPFTVQDVLEASFRGAPTPTSPNARTGNVPTITTKAEYDALPSGAEFIEDGKRYRKP